jgi:outer membrane protein assembly factor BamB
MRRNDDRLRHAFAAGVLLLLALTAWGAEPTWPQWRGPHGDGHSAETGLPVEWDAKAVLWKTPLKGKGQSSPAVWGDRIFLTTAPDDGRTRLVVCVGRKDGAVLWEQEAWAGTPEPTHAMNGWASATCATDGERVVAFFGKGGLHCYNVEGKPLWSRDLGSFPGPWGTGASPVIVGDLVIQNCDAQGEASIRAFDKNNGKDVWKTPRSSPERGGWSTPVLVKAGGRQELVLNGERAVTAYDPADGKELWSCKSFAGRGEPTVAPGKDLLYVVNGLAGDVYAVRPGGSGDVTKTHLAWHTPRKDGRDQPSPIAVGDYLLVANMAGMTTCYDSRDGKVLWRERLDGKYTAAPIAAGGLVYFLNEAGETTVIEPGPKLKIVAQSGLGARGEVFRAGLTPAGGVLLARSDRALYCIGSGKK